MKSRYEIMFAWFSVLTLGGWFGDLFLHVPQVVQWVHSTWQVISFERVRGIGPRTVLITIIKSLPALFFLIPLGAALIVSAVAWYIGPGPGDDTGIQRGSTVTDASTLARIIKRRK
ncbi:MAG: hypothetical protein ACYCXT_11090 [Acidiferrobacteraceae bacterium]